MHRGKFTVIAKSPPRILAAACFQLKLQFPKLHYQVSLQCRVAAVWEPAIGYLLDSYRAGRSPHSQWAVLRTTVVGHRGDWPGSRPSDGRCSLQEHVHTAVMGVCQPDNICIWAQIVPAPQRPHRRAASTVAQSNDLRLATCR